MKSGMHLFNHVRATAQGTVQRKRLLNHQHRNLSMMGSAMDRESEPIESPMEVIKPRVVVLGTGWGGNKVARGIDKDIYDVRVISPSNHFLFTSFLPSTAVGTLEFRAIQEPIRTCKGLGEYYQAKAHYVDTKRQEVHCKDIFKNIPFNVSYDYLVIAAGCKTNTFNTPGVSEREGKEVFFLKHLFHARQIRNRTLECFERASNPTLTPQERQRLLSFIVVGGGPTSCEFAGELHDFMKQDVSRWYPDLTGESIPK
jgi:NADH dehydrogenase FAD-containing subunit